jgi:ribulose-phosphate 3-epimerase
MADWFDALPEDRLIAEFSLWSADLVRLADDLARIAPHADILHVDVADGHFAPALLYFPDLVAAVKKVSAVPVHVHLMCADAILREQIEQFADAGADLISVHVENGNALEMIDLIRTRGLRAGAVLKVSTPVGAAAGLVGRIDMLTLLGTAIGVKGQGLDPAACDRLGAARAMVAGAGRRIVVAADGGIREHTVPDLRRAGAETVVLGSLAFGAADLGARMGWLRGLG